MSITSAHIPKLSREHRLWLRYLIADIEGDAERMRRIGHILDASRAAGSG
ncbi:MAG: hypothetical protein ACXVY5_08595 [Gaiellales bacterium]